LVKNSQNDSGEQIQLLKNIRKHINDVNENIDPIMEIFDNELSGESTQAAKYLQRKRKLHLLYSIYSMFYYNFKYQGKITDHHPVLKKMLVVKDLLDDLKKYDDTMMNQIDHILKLLQDDNDQENEEEEDEEEEIEVKEEISFLDKKRARDTQIENQKRFEELKAKKNNMELKNKEKLVQ